MKLFGFIIILSLSAFLGGVVSYSQYDKIRFVIDPPKAPITAEIELKNSCDVPEKLFFLVDLSSGRTVPFRNGRARISTVEGNKLQIQLDPKYEQVEFIGKEHVATESMEMKIDCSDPERMEKTFQALRDSLKD
mgnify:CR=1 FL=1